MPDGPVPDPAPIAPASVSPLSAPQGPSPEATQGPPWESRWATCLLVLSAALGLWFRARVALTDDGILWPDEIYQSLEPAHRLVHGYGLQAWEFVEGARNWTFPGLVAGLLWMAERLGFTEPRAYVTALKLCFALLGTGTALAVFRLARALGASALAAACGAAAFSLAAPTLYFGPRALSETASALPVALGFALACDPRSTRGKRLGGASLLGVSTLLRLQNGLFCAALPLVLLARRERRAALEALGVLSVWAVFYGGLDAVTWGGWYHSAVVYLRFNVLEGRSAGWGVSGADYYVRTLATSLTPPLAMCLLLAALFGAWRARSLFLIAFASFTLHSLIPHKELRFILPTLPLVCALASCGLDALPRPGPRLAAVLLFLLSTLGSAGAFPLLTFGKLGAYDASRAHESAFDDTGPINRLLLAAHLRPDLCGLKVEAIHLAWTGGHSYLHRPVPLYPHTGPSRSSGFYNYAITVERGNGEVVSREGPLLLVHLPLPDCTKDPAYQWRLP